MKCRKTIKVSGSYLRSLFISNKSILNMKSKAGFSSLINRAALVSLTNQSPNNLLTNETFPNPIQLCKSSRDNFLAYIMIRIDGFVKRTLIRRTWANSTLFPDITAVFVMGVSTNATISNRVSQEAQSRHHSGPIHGHVQKLKSLSAWKWILENCSSANCLNRR